MTNRHNVFLLGAYALCPTPEFLLNYYNKGIGNLQTNLMLMWVYLCKVPGEGVEGGGGVVESTCRVIGLIPNS